MVDEEQEEKGMDTTYVGIMLVVFLVLAALAIDIGYLYVSEDDLRNGAETAALAGAKEMGQRIHAQLRDGKKLQEVAGDTVQTAARLAAADRASGRDKPSALMEVANDNGNRLTTTNDITVGFWNMSTHTYTPGGTPANAMQVRTRRTAEGESAGLGNLGSIIAKISGVQQFNYTPDAIAAIPARANANFALCTEACGGCAFPEVCRIPERRMSRLETAPGTPPRERYAYTSLMYQQTDTLNLSDLICMEMPPQEVCGRSIITIADGSDNALRDMESMMYNPNVDQANKEYDRTGRLVGWWVIAPVTDCSHPGKGGGAELHQTTRYALVRISRICVPGASGCRQNNTSFAPPQSVCGADSGLYIDRISCVSCGSPELLKFPGLHPVLVK